MRRIADDRKTKIKALLLDWGGVIQRTHDVRPRHELDRSLGLPPGTVERTVFESPAWRAASLGQMTGEEAWAEILRGLGLSAAEMADVISRFFSGDELDPWLMSAVPWWRAHGLTVGLLSNALPPLRSLYGEPAPGQWHPGQWGMLGLFDAQVFSYEIGAVKPNSPAYHQALATLGLPAAGVLFVDDAPANVQAAGALGLATCLYLGTAALQECLTAHGIPLPPHSPR